MLLIDTIIGKDKMLSDFFIPHLVTPNVIDISEKCEIWGTDFQESGKDFCEFRFFKKDEVLPFITKKQMGY